MDCITYLYPMYISCNYIINIMAKLYEIRYLLAYYKNQIYKTFLDMIYLPLYKQEINFQILKRSFIIICDQRTDLKQKDSEISYLIYNKQG